MATVRVRGKTEIRLPTPEEQDRHDMGLRMAYRHKRRDRAAYLEAAMAGRRLTRTQLAAAMGVDLSYVSRIVGGWRTPSLDTTLRLADALHLDLVELAHHLVGPAYHIHHDHIVRAEAARGKSR